MAPRPRAGKALGHIEYRLIMDSFQSSRWFIYNYVRMIKGLHTVCAYSVLLSFLISEFSFLIMEQRSVSKCFHDNNAALTSEKCNCIVYVTHGLVRNRRTELYSLCSSSTISCRSSSGLLPPTSITMWVQVRADFISSQFAINCCSFSLWASISGPAG